MKTEIVLSIFGGERCVTTLEDLEAVAHAIHTKAVRESKTSAQLSTLGAEIEGQICVINAESVPSETEATRNPTPAFGEMLIWLDALRERSERLDDSTPVSAWDLMLRAFALQTALRSDDTHPDFRAAAMVNLHRLVHELKGMGL